MAKHLFLDLEDTLIYPVMDGWFNTHPINVELIKSIISQYKPDQVHIFSFAIWNQAELLRFNMGTKEMVECVFGIKLSIVPTVDDDIIPACCKVMNLQPVDFSEMCNFWGKHEAFRLYVRNKFKSTWADWNVESEVMLLDDAVVNEEFSWPDLHVKGQIVKIDLL